LPRAAPTGLHAPRATPPRRAQAAEFIASLVLCNLYVWAMALLYAPTLHATRSAISHRAGLLHDPAKFSIDDDDEPMSPELETRHDPTKFAI
jgi:hypothetical protein